MFADEDAGHITGLIPLGFVGHLVADESAIDAQILETDVLHTAFFIVTCNNREFLATSIVADVLQKHIMNATSWSQTILFVVEYAHIEELTLAEILDAYIFETYTAHQVVVAHIDGDAPLIIQLILAMVKNVDIAVSKVLHHFVFLHIAMKSYHDWVCHVSPKYGMSHSNVAATAVESFARGIDSGTIVGITTKHVLHQHIVAGKDIESIAPTITTDDLHVADGHTV